MLPVGACAVEENAPLRRSRNASRLRIILFVMRSPFDANKNLHIQETTKDAAVRSQRVKLCNEVSPGL
jgi:hypothetical protein